MLGEENGHYQSSLGFEVVGGAEWANNLMQKSWGYSISKRVEHGNPAILVLCSPPSPPTPSKPRKLTGINENAHVSIDVTGITTFPGWELSLTNDFGERHLTHPFPSHAPHRYQQWSTECLYATSQDETSQWLCQQAIYRINRRGFELVVVCGWVWSCREMAWDDCKIAIFDP